MIKANFSAYDKYVTDSLYQWDQNRVLTVTGLNLTVKPEVHFSNANLGGAIVAQADMVNQIVSVQIPNSLLMDPLRIYAHIGIYDGDEFKVVELVEIPVIPRKRPADYQLAADDFELYSFKRLENEIKNINDTWVNKNAEQVKAYVTDWLYEHPEATTTVQDGALTAAKFSADLKLQAIKDYVTPQMFGAKGDGVTDDTAAFENAVASGLPVVVLDGEYIVSASLEIGDNADVKGNGAATVKYTGNGALFNVSSAYDKRAKISGLRVQGDGANQFIKCDNADHWGASFLVDSCHVSGFSGHSVELVGCYSAEVKNSCIIHTSATPAIVSTGSVFANVLKLLNTVFLGDANKAAVFIDTTNLVGLICDSVTFEYGDTAVVGAYPANFVGCWFERLNLVTTNKNSTFIRCNTSSCEKCVDGGAGVSLLPGAYMSNTPMLASMTKSNPIAEMMDKDEFTIDRRVVEGTYNGVYAMKEVATMSSKMMCYNIPLNMLSASGAPSAAGVLFMYRVPPFANTALYKLTLTGVAYFTDGSTQVTQANAILKNGVMTEYNKTDNHTSGNYAGAFGYDKSNGAFFFKNVSGGIESMDFMVEFNTVRHG